MEVKVNNQVSHLTLEPTEVDMFVCPNEEATIDVTCVIMISSIIVFVCVCVCVCVCVS